MLQNAASDQAIHCLLTECSIKVVIKMKKKKKTHPITLKIEMDPCGIVHTNHLKNISHNPTALLQTILTEN